MYNIHLHNFEGPIDLLLYFIRRDELDIYDIPIAKITKEFVDTVEQWERIHLNVAGDFIIVKGSVPGTYRRLIKLRKQIRKEPKKIIKPNIIEVVI